MNIRNVNDNDDYNVDKDIHIDKNEDIRVPGNPDSDISFDNDDNERLLFRSFSSDKHINLLKLNIDTSTLNSDNKSEYSINHEGEEKVDMAGVISKAFVSLFSVFSSSPCLPSPPSIPHSLNPHSSNPHSFKPSMVNPHSSPCTTESTASSL
jgi:hypothetical protein